MSKGTTRAGRGPRTVGFIAGVAALVASVAMAQFGVQLATATPAAATLPGLVRATPVSSPSNGAQVKNATAVCPPFTVVVGGGARVSGINSSQMRLTRMMPVTSGSSSYYAVTAEAPTPAYVGNWQVTAYAVCAGLPAGYKIEPAANSAHNSGTFKQTAAVCSGGRRAIGGGAAVGGFGATGQIGLQLSRASGPLDIWRATGREDADGFGGDWHVTAWVICVNPIGAQVAYGSGSQSANADCPGTTQVHGAGGGGGLSDAGPVFLRVVEPLPGLRRVTAAMTGPYPGGMVAQAVCD
ncbi:MAG TPA: hypothetical protein VFR67_15390 [Pilimelia sp.]|nr:hypothetical protein [Pilimelia sp.]